MKKFSAFAFAALAALSGCASVPESIVQHPTTARPYQAAGPAAPAAPAASNGAIFQSASYRPMFEDRRARLVGDTLTILITERTSADKSAANGSSKSGSVSATIGQLFGIPTSTTDKLGLSTSGARKFEDKDTASSGNTFSSTLTVTVVEVLPNGNLVVSGEKQVAFDKGAEFIRFSGVVNPNHITAGNTVPSTQVADARAEYRTNTQIDKAQVLGALTRFFLSVLPL
ncbi:MAG: flagellar basal body L-ring protein FlgH [Herminiimonas sp.]|nr:flagellar basal body L-ring protein FlgH [Herminiimonas sp.]